MFELLKNLSGTAVLALLFGGGFFLFSLIAKFRGSKIHKLELEKSLNEANRVLENKQKEIENIELALKLAEKDRLEKLHSYRSSSWSPSSDDPTSGPNAA